MEVEASDDDEGDEGDAASVAPSSVAAGDDAVGKAQRQRATWFRKHKLDERKAHFRAVVRPALEAAGVDMETLGECLSSASGSSVQAQASSAYARLLAALPPSVATYMATRASVFAAHYGKQYKGLRAERPCADARAQRLRL